MTIDFASNKVRKRCSTKKEAVKAWGKLQARKVLQRLEEIRAADTLEVLQSLPAARCHPLKGDRQGQYALDLIHPHRLVFELAGDPAAYTDGKIVDPKKVKSVKILGVIDYHG